MLPQSCPILCDPVDCNLPGSSVHGIFQARTLESVAISFSKGSSLPRNRTCVSNVSALQVDFLPLSHQDLPPNSIQRAGVRSDALLKTFLCFSAPPPRNPQGIKTKVFAVVSGPGRSDPLPPWFSRSFLHSGHGSHALPQSPHPGCSLCVESSSPSNHTGCPPALRMWVYCISFSVRLLSQLSPLKTIVCPPHP